MRSTCMHMRSLLIAAIGGHATEADRIDLESHLEACARCRSDHDALEALRRLRRWEPAPLPDAARERARLAALARRPQPSSPRRFRRAPAFLLVGASLALLLRPGGENQFLDGDVTVQGARVSSVTGGRMVLGGPLVELHPGTAAIWDDATRTVALERGAVTVDVDPLKRQPFRVATARFLVEVMGTRFTVSLDGVATERGKVRVLGTDGTLRATVAAGERWSVPNAPARAPVPPAATPPVAPASAATAPLAHAALPDRAAEDRLARAQQALSRGDAHGARELLQPILRQPHAVAAEANLVYAESFLVEGRHADAIGRYRSVLRTFDGTPQAESALYAIAQLQLESGDRDAAAQTLALYLERHPRGRFAPEARERLDRLAGPSPR